MTRSGRRVNALAIFIQNIKDAKFKEAWYDDNWEFFKKFIEEKAIPAGGFLITLEMVEGGIFWMLCSWQKAELYGGLLHIDGYNMEAILPRDPTDRRCPQKWQKYPFLEAPNIIY